MESLSALGSAAAPKPTTTTFNDLSDDCLLMIIKEVEEMSKEMSIANWYSRPNTCTYLKNLSCTNQRVRHLCRPLLFTPHAKALPKDIDATLSACQILLSSSDIPNVVRALQVTLDGTESERYGADFCGTFVQALTAMPNLAELNLHLGNSDVIVRALRKAFRATDPTLPNVQHLELEQAPNTPFIIQACPALKTFVADHITKKWKGTFAPLPSLKSLDRFEIDTNENWTPKRLDEFLPYAKNVSELCIKGELYKTTLPTLVSHFHDLENLTSLSMTAAQWVNPAAFSSNFGLSFMAMNDLCVDPEIALESAKVFFDACPSLETFRALWSGENTCIRVDRRTKREPNGQITKQLKLVRESYWDGFPSMFKNSSDCDIDSNFDEMFEELPEGIEWETDDFEEDNDSDNSTDED